MKPSLPEAVDLVTSTEKILNGKLQFLCSSACKETKFIIKKGKFVKAKQNKTKQKKKCP